MNSPIIYWFRKDLRLNDNTAVSAAAASGRAVIPAYVHDETCDRPWALGAASRWWLHQSLGALEFRLGHLGSKLVVLRGPTIQTLRDLVRRTGAKELVFTRCYEPKARELERDLSFALAGDGIRCRRFSGALIFEPEALRTKAGEPFRVFTPFWKAGLALAEPSAPKAGPKKLRAPDKWPRSVSLKGLDLLPTSPDWAGGMRNAWTPGEEGAQDRLCTFLDNAVGRYDQHRDRPYVEGTSRLSPHLHFGEISPRQCWSAAQLADERLGGKTSRGTNSFLRELVWREFSYHLLFHWPDFPEAPFRHEFAAFPWDKNERGLKAWQTGKTGFPIVDAGMRELWHTGWMHNRVRMIVASFLVKDLLVPWQQGEAWFWDTLVDADLANNAASWQWVAGCGADAAPYFRIFNPMIQGTKFDPDGHYVRHWLPELTNLPAAHIHAPWQAQPTTLADAGVRLGKNYPLPIVDHAVARKRALEAYDLVKAAKGVSA